jgi:hypothetical protein
MAAPAPPPPGPFPGIPALPAALAPTNPDAGQERAALDGQRAALDGYLAQLVTLQAGLQAKLDDAANRFRTLNAAADARDAVVQQLDARIAAGRLELQRQDDQVRANAELNRQITEDAVIKQARSEELSRILTDQVRGRLGTDFDNTLSLAAEYAQLRKWVMDQGIQPPPQQAVNAGAAERIIAVLSDSSVALHLENYIAQLEERAAQRFGVVITRTLVDAALAKAQGRQPRENVVFSINQDAVVSENLRLTRLINELDARADERERQLARANAELTAANLRLQAAEAGIAADAVAKQYSTLASKRYVNLGNIQSPEQVRLVMLAGDAQRRTLDSQARAISATLASTVGADDQRTQTFAVLRQLALIQGGFECSGGIDGRKIVLKFSLVADANSFAAYARPAGGNVTVSQLTDTVSIVTIEWDK